MSEKNKILLEIDYREREIVDILKSKTTDINYSVNNLQIGDFVLKDDNGSIFYIIERKSIKDLCSSITDGRFREQKQRLLDSTNDSSKIVYILEGTKKSGTVGIGKLPMSTIDSAIMNLSFKHNYKVIFSDSVENTLDQVLLLSKKISTDELSTLTSTFNPVKKVDKLNIFINQLCVIQGVSLNIANKIYEKYKSMYELTNAYHVIESTDRPLLLADIMVTDKRKLGKALSTKIYNGIYLNKLDDDTTTTQKITKTKKITKKKSFTTSLDVQEVCNYDGGPGTYPKDDHFIY
jgi:ERCC4-type nuclease